MSGTTTPSPENSGATLQIVNTGPYWVEVKIINLDEHYNNYPRTVTWVVKNGTELIQVSPSVSFLKNQIKETGNITLYGFQRNTAYEIQGNITYYNNPEGTENDEVKIEATAYVGFNTVSMEEDNASGAELIFLMPPILEPNQPAFIYTEKDQNIKFKNSNYNSLSTITHLEYKLTQVSTSEVLLNEKIAFSEVSTSFSINYTWKEDTYYKVQARFLSGENSSDWSTVMVLRAIQEPQVSLIGEQEDDTSLKPGEFWYTTTQSPMFTGQYKNAGNEAVGRFRFELWGEGELKEDTGWLTHNSSTDNYEDGVLSSDNYSFKTALNQGVEYNIVYSVETENLYKVKKEYLTRFILPFEVTEGITFETFDTEIKDVSYKRKISYNKEIKTEYTTETIDHKIGISEEEGYAKLKIKINLSSIEENKRPNCYKLLRASSKDNFSSWEYLTFFSAFRTEFEFKDFLVESGVEYIYGVQDGNKQPIWTEKRIIYFEHMYLYSGGKQLKLKFNPQVSSFKRTRQAAKQDTIGGRFPTIFRNGYTDYAEFSINSLVSLQSDEENLFTTLELINTNLSDYNIAQEKEFREEVEKFLNNGKPKLFKSPTEGNFIVGLMNISFSPNTTLGRMLYSVSATVYEIAENNMVNLMNLGIYLRDKLQQDNTIYFGQKLLVDTDNVLQISNSLFTKVEIYNNQSGESKITLNNNQEIILPEGGILFYSEDELENISSITCTSGSVYINYQWKQNNTLNDILEEEDIAMFQKGKKVFRSDVQPKTIWEWHKDEGHLELVNIKIIFDTNATQKQIIINNPDRYGPTEEYMHDYSGDDVNVYNFSSAEFGFNNIYVLSDETFTVYYVEVIPA